MIKKCKHFFSTPNFNKKYIYKDPQNIFYKFTNAFAYYKMASLGSPTLDKKALYEECNKEWKVVKKHPKKEIENKISRYLNTLVQLRKCIMHVPSGRFQPSQSLSPPLVLKPPKSDEQIHYNAIVQKAASAKKKKLEKELNELQDIARITTNPEYHRNFSS
ncbi:hypothetical protein C2G38_2167286 [Gigaspora rosea]|uniref:Uncharacterized protein n=1 Tax=Gigaspora rosea TaxID=44941 RepID=A0A397VT28_9GLOM|nr:hypothetical protein C2G38_2167286 [Gigaspora rosea]